MIDKQTELWFSQPMIGTISDVTMLPIPPDHLERFKKLWQEEMAKPRKKIEILANSYGGNSASGDQIQSVLWINGELIGSVGIEPDFPEDRITTGHI